MTIADAVVTWAKQLVQRFHHRGSPCCDMFLRGGLLPAVQPVHRRQGLVAISTVLRSNGESGQRQSLFAASVISASKVRIAQSGPRRRLVDDDSVHAGMDED
jgi:hypothetical protein